MQHILAIAVRPIMHVFALAWLVKYWYSAGLSIKRGVNLVIILGFAPDFIWAS